MDFRWLLFLLVLPITALADNLVDIYRLALQNDPSFRVARASLKAGLEEEKLGLAGLLPRVDGGLGFNFTRRENLGQFPAGGVLIPNNTKTNSTTRTWNLTLNQPVLDLAAWFNFRRGRELTRQAKLQFAADQQDLILRVVEAYVAVLRARANLDASKAQERATARQLDLARQRFEVGLAAVTDVRQAEAAHDLAVARRIADEGALQVAREQLTVLTGRRHGTLWRFRETLPVTPPDPDDPKAWVRFAHANNYDIKVAALAREAALEGARAAAAGHLPVIRASASYGHSRSEVEQNNLKQDTNAAFEIDNQTGSVNLNLTVPLFAGGAISANRRQSHARFQEALERYAGVVRTTEQNTQAQFINLLTAIASVKANAKAVESGKLSLEANEAGYEVGTRTIVDVLSAVRTLYAARRDYANARLDYVLAKLRLKRLAGTLSPADIHQLNQWLTPPDDDGETN